MMPANQDPKAVEEALECVGEEGVCFGYKHRDQKPCFKHRKILAAAYREKEAAIQFLRNGMTKCGVHGCDYIGACPRCYQIAANMSEESSAHNTLRKRAEAKVKEQHDLIFNLGEKLNATRLREEQAEASVESLEKAEASLAAVRAELEKLKSDNDSNGVSRLLKKALEEMKIERSAADKAVADSEYRTSQAEAELAALRSSSAEEVRGMREALEEALIHDCDYNRCSGHMNDHVKPIIRRALASVPPSPVAEEKP